MPRSARSDSLFSFRSFSGATAWVGGTRISPTRSNRDTKAQLIAETIRQFKIGAAKHSGIYGGQIGRLGRGGQGARASGRADRGTRDTAGTGVSPRYNLASALRAVRREMVVFWSPLDVLILGAGTRLFGTIDRVKSVSSGLVGFRIPVVDDSDETTTLGYAKLRQVRWRPVMAATGYFGGHLGPDSPLFLRKYVVPLLRVEESRALLNRRSGSSRPVEAPISIWPGQRGLYEPDK